jgi:hypothetical protein
MLLENGEVTYPEMSSAPNSEISAGLKPDES